MQTIIFLGQFGGSSKYLKRRMDTSNIKPDYDVQIRYGGLSGKMNVVAGAFSERMNPGEKFVRKSETIRSYGTLIDLDYGMEEFRALFPNAEADGGIFEKEVQGNKVLNWLKVIQWEIPKVSDRFTRYPR